MLYCLLINHIGKVLQGLSERPYKMIAHVPKSFAFQRQKEMTSNQNLVRIIWKSSSCAEIMCIDSHSLLPILFVKLHKLQFWLATTLLFIRFTGGIVLTRVGPPKPFHLLIAKQGRKKKKVKSSLHNTLSSLTQNHNQARHAEKKRKKKRDSQQTLGTRTSREEVSVLAALVQRGLPSRLWLRKNHYRGIPLHKTPVAQSPKHAFNLPKSNACQ